MYIFVIYSSSQQPSMAPLLVPNYSRQEIEAIILRLFDHPFITNSSSSFVLYAACTFLAITAPSWIILLYCRSHHKNRTTKTTPAAEELENCFVEAQDAFSQGIEDDSDTGYTDQRIAYDTEYPEKMKFNDTSSSMEGQTIDAELTNLEENHIGNFEDEVRKPAFCKICMENKESWEMFVNDTCSDSFCYNCTTNHVLARIHDRAMTITCPGVNCNAILNSGICRLLIPDDALVQWDGILCESLIPEAEKLYCPFRDCSAMLVNDTGEVGQMENCVACKRSFCASCRVPWHSEFTCEEFQKLYDRKGGKDDKIVKFLAKKKKWQQCPKCKMYVEKVDGCMHITCRCKYEFCYICGRNWSESHRDCLGKI